jgi:hypothetical protein
VNDKEKRGMVIHFTDGTKKVLEFPPQLADNDASMAEKLRAILSGRNLTIEAEGALIVIPLENVKYIQSYPAPKKLPAGVIRGASFRD